MAKIKAEARKADQESRTFSTLFTRKWSHFGGLWADVRDKELFKHMNPAFSTLDEWREDARIGRSTMYRYMRLHDALPESQVPRKIREQITAENADHLVKLPDKKRFDKTFWDRAIDMKEGAFKAYVEPHLGAKGSDASGVEGRKKLTIGCYVSQYEFITETLNEWSRNNNLGDDHGRALELICAEVRGGLDKERKAIFASIATFVQSLKEHFGAVQALDAENEQMPLEDRYEKLNQHITGIANDLTVMTKGWGADAEQLQLAGWVPKKKKAEPKPKSEAKPKAKAAASAMVN